MATSHVINLDGPVHYVDHGGAGTPIVLVHGLGGSHTNWTDVAPLLASRGRVLALDLVGFGLTPPANRSSSVRANRHIVSRFIDAVAGEPVVLMGNSMGGLIAMMQAAGEASSVRGVALVNPAVPPASYAHANRTVMLRLILPTAPLVGPALLDRYTRSRTPEQLITETIEFVCADPSRVSAEHIAQSVAMLHLRRNMAWSAHAFTEASRSIARILVRRRAFDAMARRVRAPVLLVHGDRDELVEPDAARRLATVRPDWTFHMFAGVGHVPQIETPEPFLAVVHGWMEDHQLAPAG